MARADVLTSAAEIVDAPILVHRAEPVLPNTVHLTRTVNRSRHALRHEEPRDLDFLINEEHIPQDFLHADITIGTKRHLVFATERMLDLLSKAKRWHLE